MQGTYGGYHTNPEEPFYDEPSEPPSHFGEADFDEDASAYHATVSHEEPVALLTAVSRKGLLSHCKRCGQDFKSSNKLHKHLREECSTKAPKEAVEPEANLHPMPDQI